MRSKFKHALRPALFVVVLAAIASVLFGCEMIVQLDLTLVDAGPDSGCQLCVDGTVVYDEAGDPIAIVPGDARASDSAAPASDASPE